MEVEFHDRTMRSWKFRYCYLRTSQSFAFRSGWSSFVKEKGLKVNDTISFFLCETKARVDDDNDDKGGLLVEGAKYYSCVGLHHFKKEYVQKEVDQAVKEKGDEVIMEEAAANPFPN
ncbi:B3 DNA binding domain containing protein [Parasponia andersonii]|uniref:B3 DNA binding domain containing protein n=1 Tax=Parasponia andersonii TaxID=3476 RepID=A0A2P5DDS9_PARAD|nr:B3 DNA binding domain containing protein [Parasponia andersonii]